MCVVFETIPRKKHKQYFENSLIIRHKFIKTSSMVITNIRRYFEYVVISNIN